MCSHLATLTVDERKWSVIIEEIWREGAILECEEDLPEAEFAQLDCGGPFFGGALLRAHRHAFGWRAEMRFSNETQWSEETFRPSHLLDPREVKGPKKDAGRG